MLSALIAIALAPVAGAHVLASCTCIDTFSTLPDEQLPANALHFVYFCQRGEPPLDRISATVDGRPVRIRLEPGHTHDNDFAFRLDPEPSPGQRVHVQMCARATCNEENDFYTLDYLAGPRDDDPPHATGKPRIEDSGRDDDINACNPYAKVLVHVDDIDMSAEPILYGEVRMTGPAGSRAVLSRLHDQSELIDEWHHVPAEVDVYEGRWCADLTLLDAAGNTRAIGQDCEHLSCACTSSRDTPPPWLLVLAAFAARRRRARRA